MKRKILLFAITATTIGLFTSCQKESNQEVYKRPAGALPGKFSVSDTKQVYFSQGNLTYDVSTKKWAFYHNQYDYDHDFNPNVISLFTWGYNAAKSIVPNGEEMNNIDRTSGDFSQSEDWGSQIGDGKTWRTLTITEWMYLLYLRKTTGPKFIIINEPGITIEGVNFDGLVLYPDDYDDFHFGQMPWNNFNTWSQLKDAGLVFLPRTGFRQGSHFFYHHYGQYWSSSVDKSDPDDAANMISFSSIDGHDIHIGDEGRDTGHSVRLVTNSR